MLFGRSGSYNYSAIHSIKFPQVSQRTFKTKGLISIEGTFFWDTLYSKTIVPASSLFQSDIGALSQVKYIAHWLTYSGEASPTLSSCHAIPIQNHYHYSFI